MNRSRSTFPFLMALTAIAVYLCYLLVAPFLKPIIVSVILAVVFYPVHTRTHHWIRNRNIAAALATSVLIVLLTSLSFFLGRALLLGLRDIYESLAGSGEGRERLSVFVVQVFDRAIAWASHYVSISVPSLQRALLGQVEKVVADLLATTAGVVGGVSSFGVNTFVAIFILFFLFRDGRTMLRCLGVMLPIRPDQTRRLSVRVKDTFQAIVYGTLAMAAIQGALTGLGFWVLGLTSPVVWGLVAALLAVFPVVGTTCVWLPATCMLFFSGHWIKALVLLTWGTAVIHPVDNILRPYLIGGRVKLSTLFVFFALLGGLKAFGPLGLFIGPLILAVTVALLTFVREEGRAGSWRFQFSSEPDDENLDRTAFNPSAHVKSRAEVPESKPTIIGMPAPLRTPRV